MKQAHFINFRYNFEQETKHELVGCRINWRGEVQLLPGNVALNVSWLMLTPRVIRCYCPRQFPQDKWQLRRKGNF